MFENILKEAPTIEPCEDAISREAAIKALIETPREEVEFDKGTGVIQELPSVAPSRPSGEWIEGRYMDPEWISPMADFYKCSICGKIVNLLQMRSYNYCPSCGARMKGADDADE